MTLLGAKGPDAWRPRDVLLAAICEGRQLLRISGIANQLPLLQALLLLVSPSSLQLAAILQLHHCVTAFLSYCVIALLHYCIIALLHSWAPPQKAWIASLRFLCDSALSELVTGFVGAFYLRVPAFDLRLLQQQNLTSNPFVAASPNSGLWLPHESYDSFPASEPTSLRPPLHTPPRSPPTRSATPCYLRYHEHLHPNLPACKRHPRPENTTATVRRLSHTIFKRHRPGRKRQRCCPSTCSPT